MEIKEQTENELTIQNDFYRDIGFTAIAGLFPLIFGIAFLYAASPENLVLSCQKKTPSQTNCYLKKENLFFRDKQEKLVSGVNAAIVASRDNGNFDEYSLILKSKSGNIPVLVYDDKQEEDAKLVSNQINNFLADSQEETLIIDESIPFSKTQLAMGIGGLITSALVWGIGIFLTRKQTLNLNKSLKRITFSRQGLFRHQFTEYNLNDIIEVVLEEYIDQEDASTYRVSLLLANSDRILLTKTYSNDWENEKNKADAISTFLNVNLGKTSS
ncbi:MAG: hypothetical protein ACOC04_05650 [Halothece sp.]